MFFIGFLIFLILLVVYTIYKNQQHTIVELAASFKETSHNILNLNNNLKKIIELLDNNSKTLNDIKENVYYSYKYLGIEEKVIKERKLWWVERKENFIKFEMKRLNKSKNEISRKYLVEFDSVELTFFTGDFIKRAEEFNEFAENLIKK